MQALATIPSADKSLANRQTMVDCQIRTFDVTDQHLLARLLAVPRELFVPDDYRDLAYSDVGMTLPPQAGSPEGRYLLPPFILARMIQGGRVHAHDRVLDLAGGLGYSAALLAGLARDVVAVEDSAERAQAMLSRLDGLGLARATVRDGNLAEGYAASGPYDVILINGAVETGLDKLFEQLAEGGRLVAIRRSQADPTGRAAKAICYEKLGGAVGSRFLFDAAAPVLLPFRQAFAFSF